ncbi:MAG: UDP-N-acetylglucosamine--N-acetylmuramyl-(pentapeptide) pyrophosphoryl-undecaprenol N-acetylglucosamine transferase, partial [Bacteroidota bacterium]
NVKALVAEQAAIHIADPTAQQDLGPAIINLLHDADRRRTLAQNMKRLAKPNATTDIVALIQQLAQPHTT